MTKQSKTLKRHAGSHSKGTAMDNGSGVLSWTVDDVCEWLENSGMGKYKDAFRKHYIDGLALLLLSEADLKQDLNISVTYVYYIFYFIRPKFKRPY